MTALEFDSNASNARCVLLHQERGQVWDASVPGWVNRPADGSIPPGAVLVPAPLAPRGPLAGLYRQVLAVDRSDLVGASLAVFAADAKGNLGDRVDYYTSPWFADLRYARGGWTRG